MVNMNERLARHVVILAILQEGAPQGVSKRISNAIDVMLDTLKNSNKVVDLFSKRESEKKKDKALKKK